MRQILSACIRTAHVTESLGKIADGYKSSLKGAVPPYELVPPVGSQNLLKVSDR